MGMFNLSTPELILVLAIVLVLFGGKRLPELTKGIADSIREIKKAMNDEPEEKTKKRKDTDD